jgi:hypothetical protein
MVTWYSDSRRVSGLEIGFIDYFNTWLVTTLNYSVIADLHTLQIPTAHAKPFQSPTVSTSRFSETDFNNEDSSTALLSSQTSLQLTSRSKSKSYCDWRSVSQSVSLGVEPHLGSRPDIYYCLIVTVFLSWGALSDEETGLSFVRVIVCSSK